MNIDKVRKCMGTIFFKKGKKYSLINTDNIQYNSNFNSINPKIWRYDGPESEIENKYERKRQIEFERKFRL